MDADRFDALSRSLTASGSRRQAVAAFLGGVLGSAVGAALIEEATAKKRCSPCKKRKQGKCKKVPNGTACAGGTCQSGHCAAAPLPAFTPPSCLQPIPGHADGTQGLNTAIGATSVGGTLVLCAGTWTLTSTIEISKDLTLLGAGDDQTILSGEGTPGTADDVRVLRISRAGLPVPPTVTVQDLQITKCNATGNFPSNIGGGIFNEGMLTLIGSHVTGNTATGGHGGGIYNNLGTLTIKAGSRVRGNFAQFDGAGITNFGGIVTLNANSRVTGNGTGGIRNDKDANPEGRVTLDAGAIVCANFVTDCSGPSIFGVCPSPAPPAPCPV
jgi:hypothetical protein